MKSEPSLRHSTLSTVIVMASTFASRLLGFARVAIIGAVFGASGNADVLNLVFNIPNNLRKLLAEGALSSAFIPVLSSTIVRDESGKSSRDVVRSVLTLQFVILLPVLLLCIIFAQPIVNTILDFPELSRQELAADLFRLLINYLLLISVSAVLMGTINSHNRFLIPALTPLLFSLSVISSIVLLHKHMGIFSMAVGVLAGGVLQILFQAPLFQRLGYSFTPFVRGFRNPDFRKIMRQWLPVVAAASIFTVNQQVAVFFASGLESGSGSAMTNALTFWQLPFGIFGAAITTVLFPRMSRQASSGDIAGLRETLQYGFRYLLALLVPSALIMSLLGKDIISVALQRGEFLPQNTALAADVLVGYSWGLFSVAAFNFFQRFYYARDDFKTPVWTALVTLVLDVGLSLWLKDTRLGVVGLAVANSVAFTVGLLLLVYRASLVLSGISVRRIAVTCGKVAFTLVPVAVFILLFKKLTGEFWMEGSNWKNLGLVLIGGLGSLGITAGMYYVLRVEAFQMILRRKSVKP